MTGLPQGHSGYFSAPSHGLDPALFDAEHLKPDVRSLVLGTLKDELRQHLSLTGVDEWLYTWIAGSGVTYQWNGDRGDTGDLDVLFGADYARFAGCNPQFKGVPESGVAAYVTQELKTDLWPRTTHMNLNGTTYEVTYFWNPGTGRDIRSIHPYAAYDLRLDRWAVRPPVLPADPGRMYPRDWYQAADLDTQAAGQLLDAARSGSNHVRERAYAGARTLFTAIHAGRRAAFSEMGKGYGDYNNFRWQRAKQTGAIAGLHQILQTASAQEENADQELYGGPVQGPDVLLTRAMIRYQSDRYDR